MLKIAELRQARAAKITLLGTLVEQGGQPYDDCKAEVATLDGQIARMVEQQALARGQAAPTGEGGEVVEVPEPARLAMVPARSSASIIDRSITRSFDQWNSLVRAESGFSLTPDKHFRTFGEQLQAVAMAAGQQKAGSGSPDNRLIRAPLGAGEVDPTGGGFLVQTDFANTIFTLAHDMGQILSRVQRLPISSNSNGIKIPGVDETSRVTGSRWGGVSSQWVDEGTAGTASKPKFRMIELSLKKLISTMYITDELLQDTTALTALAGQAFSEEIAFMTEDAVWEGTGAGVPVGVMNSPALISVAKESSQAANTILIQNILNMWSRMWARSRPGAVWFINQDIEPQLFSMTLPVGLGGGPVYMPQGGLSGSPYAMLLGRPVIATEYNATLGTQGDIVLADMSQYLLADKGGVNAATSMHVAFLTDQMTFRMTYRVDGKPIWTKPMTPFKGTNTKSPFVALATRS